MQSPSAETERAQRVERRQSIQAGQGILDEKCRSECDESARSTRQSAATTAETEQGAETRDLVQAGIEGPKATADTLNKTIEAHPAPRE